MSPSESTSDATEVHRHAVAPLSFEDAARWAIEHGCTQAIAERRFVQLRAVQAIAADAVLRDRLVLRGSSAMWLAYTPQRTADDLDFIDLARAPGAEHNADKQQVQTHIQQVLTRAFADAEPAVQAAAHRTLHIDIRPVRATPVIRRWVRFDDGNLVQVVDVTYLVAEKLCAQAAKFTTGKPRPADILDLALLLDRCAPAIKRAEVDRHVTGQTGQCLTDLASVLDTEAVSETTLRQSWERLRRWLVQP